MKTAELQDLDYPPPETSRPGEGLHILTELSLARRVAYRNGDMDLVMHLNTRIKSLSGEVEHT